MIGDSMPDDVVRIFVAGDVLNYGVVDGILCEESLAEVVAGADYSICNFEAPVHSEAKADKTVGPVRSQVKATLAGLKGQGFDCVLLANNHMFDYGVAGFSETVKEAARVGLDFLGAGRNKDAAYEPLLKTVKGCTVAFINACEAQHGVLDESSGEDDAGYAWIFSPRVDALVTGLRESCDFVVVLAHAGLEESPVPQWQWKSRYRALCDKGADAVIASHPHVPQGYELYNGKLIAYSLGNFYFDSPKYAHSPDHSYSVLVELCKGRDIKVNVVPHYKEAGKVRIDRRQLLDVDSLCDLLKDDYGRQEAGKNEETLAVLRRSLRLSTTPFPFDRGVKSVLGRLRSIFRGNARPVDKDALLLHLLRNESYRYAAISALERRMRRSRL